MADNCGYCYRCCDACVTLIHETIIERGTVNWWELTVLLAELPHHTPRKRQTLLIYPSVSSIPETHQKAISGFLFIDIPPKAYKSFRKSIRSQIAPNTPIGFEQMRKYMWETHIDCWLNLELQFDSEMIFGKIGILAQDINILSRL